MQIKINGKPEEVREETVLHLLKSRNIEPQMVTVELNAKILQKEELSTTRLKEGDEVEFLFFMGGGADLSGPTNSPQKAF